MNLQMMYVSHWVPKNFRHLRGLGIRLGLSCVRMDWKSGGGLAAICSTLLVEKGFPS